MADTVKLNEDEQQLADLGYKQGMLPVSEKAAAEVLALPIYAELPADVLAEMERDYPELAEMTRK